ncbi:MAG: PEP-CTERM sorting domain-containing protein [Desulfobacula sp.]|uniref:hypothetical protein n=1 Tax=Desulfobacula sp. TaxID=2593537 RepID=UPI0025BB71C6|nr:hypothetical protein [Desulfobacula sp.]MCD4719342.1 PEP-CTERM sorting domain-containing protein [Desulfobacula sp.]
MEKGIQTHGYRGLNRPQPTSTDINNDSLTDTINWRWATENEIITFLNHMTLAIWQGYMVNEYYFVNPVALVKDDSDLVDFRIMIADIGLGLLNPFYKISSLTADYIGLNNYFNFGHEYVEGEKYEYFVPFRTASYELGLPVPIPATMILFGAGLLGLAGINRKNRTKHKNKF